MTLDCQQMILSKPRLLRRAQLNGISKGGEQPLWSRAGFKPRSRIYLIGPPFLSQEAADEPFGISNSKSQTANLKFAIWDFRFRASLGQGPSAAAGRLVLLERELI